ncbi:MAG: hypothetical protein WAK01_06145 [Methylocystis sp.]
MDWKLFAQLLVTFVVAAGGWWTADWSGKGRDLENERRKTVTTFLLDAYRRLEAGSNRQHSKTKQKEYRDGLESAIADIQLLGSPHQTALARDFVNQFAEGRRASLDPLLNDLRNSLRKELNLAPLSDDVIFFRYVFADEFTNENDRTLPDRPTAPPP